jgi:hypothetical protein
MKRYNLSRIEAIEYIISKRNMCFYFGKHVNFNKALINYENKLQSEK